MSDELLGTTLCISKAQAQSSMEGNAEEVRGLMLMQVGGFLFWGRMMFDDWNGRRDGGKEGRGGKGNVWRLRVQRSAVKGIPAKKDMSVSMATYTYE